MKFAKKLCIVGAVGVGIVRVAGGVGFSKELVLLVLNACRSWGEYTVSIGLVGALEGVGRCYYSSRTRGSL